MKKHYLLVLMMFVLVVGLLIAGENSQPSGKKMVSINPGGLTQPSPYRDAPAYTITQNPTALVTSYYDYMIGSYNSIPIKIQPAASGENVYITYHAKRTATGQRRVFYTLLDNTGAVVNNTEITAIQNWEGYPGLDIDPVSGKTIFAWHANTDGTTDAEYEVQVTWDAFLEGISIIADPITVIDNPLSITSGTTTTTDNEFLWPKVSIGPSPNAGFRRVYISAGNASEHTGGKASENVYIAYADFDANMLETGATLTWTFTSIPTLDAWNVDTVQWRRPYYSFLAGDDGKVYYIGYHLAYNADDTEINEPTMDVFINENYGAGTWRQVSAEASLPGWNPPLQSGTEYYFTDDNDVAYPDSALSFNFTDSGHFNAVYDAANDAIHFPGIYGLGTNEGTYYPALQFVRHFAFDTDTETFTSNQVYPQSSNTSLAFVPWDLDDNHQVDEYSTDGYPLMATIWPFCHWDETAHENALLFHYNNIKITEPNSQGMMAMVWQDSWRSRMYNKYPDSYPEYAAYATTPEIYISVSPDFGATWTEPIVLDNVETTQFSGLIPMWTYPAETVKYMSTTPEGNDVGRLYLMFFDDNSWGSYQQTAPLGQNDGGAVMYMALDIVYPAANDDTVINPMPSMLAQNYPNPFNPETALSFNLHKSGQTTLSVYNAKGQLVKTLLSGLVNAGEHTIVWNGTDDLGTGVSSGLYFYRLVSNGKSETRKMMLMK